MFSNSFSALEYSTTKNKVELQLVNLTQKKDELLLTYSETHKSFKNLKNKLLKNPTHLIINDDSVVTKRINTFENDEKKVVLEAFPNINISEFYYSVLLQSNYSFVCLCRKDIVNSVLQKFENEQIDISRIYIGNIAVKSFAKFSEENLYTSNAEIAIENHEIVNISPKIVDNNKEQILNGLCLNPNSLLCAASIISYLGGDKSNKTNLTILNDSLQASYKQKHYFNLAFKSILGVLFVSLLVNFLLFSDYSNKIAMLESSLILNKTNKANFSKLKDNVNKKKQLLQGITNTSKKVSKYLDKIGQLVPASIQLSELQYQPISKRIEENKPIVIEPSKITISGASQVAKDFSDWTKNLENIEYFKEVVILNYGFNKRKKQTTFEISIDLYE